MGLFGVISLLTASLVVLVALMVGGYMSGGDHQPVFCTLLGLGCPVRPLGGTTTARFEGIRKRWEENFRRGEEIGARTVIYCAYLFFGSLLSVTHTFSYSRFFQSLFTLFPVSLALFFLLLGPPSLLLLLLLLLLNPLPFPHVFAFFGCTYYLSLATSLSLYLSFLALFSLLARPHYC